MVISFFFLDPVHPFLSSMAVLYHVNKEREQQRQRRLRERLLKSEVALLQTLSGLIHLARFVKCWKLFLELNSKRLYQSSESCCLVFTSSTKRDIMHFHVLVVQWRKRNVGKSVMHVQGCCFVNLNLGLLTAPENIIKYHNTGMVMVMVMVCYVIFWSGQLLFLPFSLTSSSPLLKLQEG